MIGNSKVQKPTRRVALKLKPQVLAMLDQDKIVRNEEFRAMYQANRGYQVQVGNNFVPTHFHLPERQQRRSLPERQQHQGTTPRIRLKRSASELNDTAFKKLNASVNDLKSEYFKVKEERDQLLQKSRLDRSEAIKAKGVSVTYLEDCLTSKNDRIEALEAENASLKARLQPFEAIEAVFAKHAPK
ncbi:hypothetical protein DM02DRAFT_684023 [Periconia macrospinosa]|uniref:Uncharacterized protein n=1 Tax=Periconia macrospinosa TaxID=97972 RepID=A0A2V1E6D7_9PLEO|nr:hypothetical protein DM02DRAFT_684023 [Periconia macrospinosa]